MQIKVIPTQQQITQALAYVWGCEASAVIVPDSIDALAISITTDLKGANQAERYLAKVAETKP